MRRGIYKPDTELTIRMFGTLFLLGLVYLVFMGVLLAAGTGILMMVVFAGVMLLIQYFTSDKLVLWSMRAKVVTPQEMPKLHAMIERLAQVVEIPKPKVAVATTDLPNAFATGRNPGHSVVCVTTGLMQRLNDDELEGVLGHELTHIKNRDVMVMTLASFFATLAGMLVQMLSWSFMFGGMGGGRGRDRQNGAAAIMMIFVASAIVYVVSQLLILALSRYREFAADRGGAIFTGAPAVLASALMKISGTIARIPQEDLRRVEGASAFFIVPAFNGQSLTHLFATHPPVEERVARLRRLQQEMEQL